MQSRRFRGVETALENRPPIGQHTFTSDLICQRMTPEGRIACMGCMDVRVVRVV